MIKITKYIIGVFCCLNFATVFAQVEVEGTLNFTNASDSLRNIYNISKSDSLNEVVRANEYIFQKYFENNVSVIDSVILITADFEFPNYTTGMNLILTIPVLTDTINTPKYLKVNQQNPVLIKTVLLDTITNKEVKSGHVFCLIYNGTDFLAINTQHYKCPNDYKKMNDKYCIQKTRNAQETFWNATKFCNDNGYHLCTYQEWYYACINNSGMSNMPQNWEWVHTTSNHNIHALKIGNTSSCTVTDSETTAVTGLPMYFRCCYHLR